MSDQDKNQASENAEESGPQLDPAVEQAISQVRQEYQGDIIDARYLGLHELVFTISADQIVEFCQFIIAKGWWHLSTITGQDLGEDIQMLYHFNADEPPAVTVVTSVPKATASIKSITPQIPAATMYEREIYDLLGVVFEGHPKPERLVLSDDWPDDVFPAPHRGDGETGRTRQGSEGH